MDGWATQARTNYSHLEDAETAAWISGTEADVAADVAASEADFNAQTDQAVVADAEAGDALQRTPKTAAAQTEVHAEADAVVADVSTRKPKPPTPKLRPRTRPGRPTNRRPKATPLRRTTPKPPPP